MPWFDGLLRHAYEAVVLEVIHGLEHRSTGQRREHEYQQALPTRGHEERTGNERGHQPAAQIAVVNAPGGMTQRLQAATLEGCRTARLPPDRPQEKRVEVLAAARRGGILGCRKTTMVAVDVLDGKLGI